LEVDRRVKTGLEGRQKEEGGKEVELNKLLLPFLFPPTTTTVAFGRCSSYERIDCSL